MGQRVPAERYFTAEEIARARAYHRPLYVYSLLGSALTFAYLAVLTFTRAGRWVELGGRTRPLWAAEAVDVAAILGVGAIVRFPLSVWRWRYERWWGFSTQPFRAWLWDWAKGLVVSTAIMALGLVALVETAASVPNAWPLVAAPAAAAVVVLLSFVAPVVLEPIFNRFRPLEDESLTASLLSMAERAGVAVRRVLVADASRRTKKENAYVSGLSRSRRVVVYDTLLERGSPREVEVVTAHELGHWRARHVRKGTALAAAGVVAGVIALWIVAKLAAVQHAAHLRGAFDPAVTPFLLLLFGALGALAAPFGNAVSRRWEREADLASIELTGDARAFADMEHNLATRNLLDLDPPRLAYALWFTHPTLPERIEAATRTPARSEAGDGAPGATA